MSYNRCTLSSSYFINVNCVHVNDDVAYEGYKFKQKTYTKQTCSEHSLLHVSIYNVASWAYFMDTFKNK